MLFLLGVGGGGGGELIKFKAERGVGAHMWGGLITGRVFCCLTDRPITEELISGILWYLVEIPFSKVKLL